MFENPPIVSGDQEETLSELPTTGSEAPAESSIVYEGTVNELETLLPEGVERITVKESSDESPTEGTLSELPTTGREKTPETSMVDEGTVNELETVLPEGVERIAVKEGSAEETVNELETVS